MAKLSKPLSMRQRNAAGRAAEEGVSRSRAAAGRRAFSRRGRRRSGAFCLVLLALLALAVPAAAGGRELTLAREMLEDAIVREDADGMELARLRLLRLAAGTADLRLLRDVHHLAALAALYESFSAYRDAPASARLAITGMEHADRALALDPQLADAWMVSAMLRWSAQRAGAAAPADPPGTPNRFARALALDPKSPAVALFAGIARSSNPAGPAHPEGVRILDELVERLDAERAASGRRFGLWDAEAHAWKLLVRTSAEEPNAEALRPLAARLLQARPDHGLARLVAQAVAERRFVAPPQLTWRPLLRDAANDGQNPELPDVIAAERAEAGERVWYRITFREPLPRSFGVNVVVNRTGDPTRGMAWWGGGSTFRFDRLVTAWISRDGDRYFGRVGVADEDGARAARLSKLSDDVHLSMGGDGHSVLIGVPREVLGLTETSEIVVAAGSHLVWNDDATISANSR